MSTEPTENPETTGITSADDADCSNKDAASQSTEVLALTDDDLLNRYTYLPRGAPGLFQFREHLGSFRSTNRLCTYADQPSVLLGLPSDILIPILSYLDLDSLESFRATSRSSSKITHYVLGYSQLRAHAQPLILSLRRLKLSHWLSVSELYAALQSEECVGCASFATYIFLPRLQRVCLFCLQHKAAFQVLPTAFATSRFNITTAQIYRTIPNLPNLQYGGGWNSNHIVCLSDVKDLALEVHGSVEHISGQCTAMIAASGNNHFLAEHFRTGQRQIEANFDVTARVSHTAIAGLGDQSLFNTESAARCSLQLPPLVRNTFQGAFWCRGCYFLFAQTMLGIETRLPAGALQRPTVRQEYFKRCLREWSHREFLKHARACDRVRAMHLTNSHIVGSWYFNLRVAHQQHRDLTRHLRH